MNLVLTILFSMTAAFADPEVQKAERNLDEDIIAVDVAKVQADLKKAKIVIDLSGYTGQVIVFNSNDRNPVKNYVVALKNPAGIPKYMVGLDKESNVQLIDQAQPVTARHQIKRNKKVMDGKTISNLQFWTIDELANEGVILNVYKDKLTAALKINVQNLDGEAVDTTNFTRMLEQDPNIIDRLEVSAQVFYVKNVPFNYNGSVQKVDLELETDNFDLTLSKNSKQITHMHFNVGTFGIDSVVFNENAAKALQDAQ